MDHLGSGIASASQVGNCERCTAKYVSTYYLECSGRGPNGQTYLKIWLVCIHCFFDLVDVSLANGLGCP
jgi:hypothetical protein